MRLITIILVVSLTQVSAATLAQGITLKEKNASLESVLKEIRRQSGFDMVYDLNLILKAEPVNINFNHANIYEAIQKTLAQQSLSFSIENNIVVIKERTILDKIASAVQFANDVKVIVRDTLGRPMPGASIYIKSINRQFVTDGKGEFIVRDVPENGLILVVSYIGAQMQEVFVNRSTGSPYIIVLKSNTSNLTEINVVSTGYQQISKERAAGSYSTLSAKDIESTPSVNLLERMEGKVPGVRFNIKNNTIQIRGVNNYAGASGTPLIVVDGFPLMSPSDQARLTNLVSGNASGNSIISSLNPADIEQVTFLKDASATSIWGSRAANGVIVIETKKGKRNTNTLNFGYTFGVSKNPSLSSLKWMNSAQYINLEQEMVDKGYLVDPAATTGANAVYVANNSEATEWMYKVKRGTATVAQRDAALAELGSRNAYGQIEKYLLQNNVDQQYNLSLSGGSDNSTYYVSGNYTKNTPIYKGNQSENSFINARTTTDLFNKRITIRTGLNYQFSRSLYNAAAVNALSVSTTALRPYDLLVDGAENSIGRTILFRQSIADNYIAQGYLPFSYNTIDQLNYSNTTTKNNIFRINAGVNGRITSWLNADVSLVSQRQIGNGSTINELNSYASRILVNTGTVITNGKPVYNVPYGGTYLTSNQNAYDTSVRGQLNADYTIHKDHHLNAIAGMEIRETGTSSKSETRYGYNSDSNTSQAVNPTTSYMTMYGYSSVLGDNLGSIVEGRKRYLSYFSNASYAFQNKYIVTGSIRFDDYTLQGIDRSKRAIPFWSAGLRWNAEQEDFLNSTSSWLDGLALRSTIGTSGVVPQGGSNITVISVSGTDSRTGQPIAQVSTPGNSDLGWETTRSVNLGTDFRLFKGRLSGSFDIYGKKTSGLLSTFPANGTYGWSSLLYNSGTLKGHGYEFGLTGEILRKRKFSWLATANFGYTTNTVNDIRYVNNNSSLAGIGSIVAGVPLGALYVYKFAGLDNKGQSQIFDRNNNVIANTTNLTTAFTKDDLKYAGTTNAPYTGGFFNTFRYGNLELSMQVSAYLGYVFLKQSIDNYPTDGTSTYSGVLGRQVDLAYRWRKAGDEATTNVPGLKGINNNSFVRYRYSDLLIRNADNIRLQQVSLAYTVPIKYLPKSVFKSLSVSANIRNLGILWRANKDGIDPEYLNAASYSNLPPTKSYVFGLNASF